jgi:hypothetical protein
VVQRYDIDGVHIVDYFYPYPLKDAQGRDIPFPDEPSWQRAGAPAHRAAWRRAQVDQLIERLHAAIHVAKPWVRFGISPFGLPRPDRRPPGITGFSQYDQLHADVERWLSEGWLDYLAPQLYWPIAQTAQAFPVLLDAWLRDNPRGRHIWAGLFTSRIGDKQRPYTPQEVQAQIDIVRERTANNPLANGHIHFSMVALAANREGVADRLREGPYAQPALPPATPWLAEPPPARPEVTLTPLAQPGSARLAWQPPAGSAPWRYAVLAKAVSRARNRRRDLIQKVQADVESVFAQAHMDARISGREKTLYSIYKKMDEKHLSFAQVTDIYGFRVIVPSVIDCYTALGLLHQIYKFGEQKAAVDKFSKKVMSPFPMVVS